MSWWHDLQGGKIAEERPPPPGTDQPYPNLATVPPKPERPDSAVLANIASALVADRANAQHVAAAAPIADPSLPSASPNLFGRGTVPPPPPPPPPGTANASATMAAAEAPPAPAAPAAPAKAPVAAVQSAPLAPPGATAQPPAVEPAPPPEFSAAPPPPANLPGAAASAPPSPPAPPAPVAPAVAPPPAAPPPAAPPAVAAAAAPPPSDPANSVSLTFVTGSAALPTAGADTLKQLAARRGSGMIAVTGYGDAASNDPDAQSAALSLGLSRAQAMAAVLTAAGVPATAVQVDAAAVGRGGTARLVQ